MTLSTDSLSMQNKKAKTCNEHQTINTGMSGNKLYIVFSNFIGKCQSNAKQDINKQNRYLFGNHNIVFEQKSLFFTSFAQSGIKRINDILSEGNTRV